MALGQGEAGQLIQGQGSGTQVVGLLGQRECFSRGDAGALEFTERLSGLSDLRQGPGPVRVLIQAAPHGRRRPGGAATLVVLPEHQLKVTQPCQNRRNTRIIVGRSDSEHSFCPALPFDVVPTVDPLGHERRAQLHRPGGAVVW